MTHRDKQMTTQPSIGSNVRRLADNAEGTLIGVKPGEWVEVEWANGTVTKLFLDQIKHGLEINGEKMLD